MSARHFVYALIDGLNVRYVGYSAQLERRQKDHARKYPEWRMITLGLYPTHQIMVSQEKWWIKRLHEAGHPLVNIQDGGSGGVPGRTVSFLTRARLSEAFKRRTFTSEARAKMSVAKKGKALTPEHRAKISAALRGKKNKPLSQEHRVKLSAIGKGRVVTPETRAKISVAQKGRTFMPEHRAKLSAAQKGKPWSAARRAAYEKRRKEVQ